MPPSLPDAGKTPSGPGVTPDAGTPAGSPAPAPRPGIGPQGPRDTGRTAARGTTPGGRGRKRSSEAFNWQHWWSNNQYRFLDFTVNRALSSGSADFFLGSSDRESVRDVDALTPAAIRDTVIPALAAQLASPDGEVRAAAVKALGRIADGVPLAEMARLLGDTELHVRFSAAIALGDAGAAAYGPELARIARDARENPIARGFSLVSLGLIGDEASALVLREVALGDDPNLDLRASALVALGLVRTKETAALMKTVAADSRRDENLRAIAAEALGRLGVDDATAEFLFGLLEDKSPQVRRSAIVALGQGRAGCPSTGAALADAFDLERDLPARAFAAIAIGEQKGPKAKKVLLDAYTSSPQPALKAFAAIGLGILGDLSAAPHLRETLESASSGANLRAASAVALGLLRDSGSKRLLSGLVSDAGADPLVRGYSALAIGLVGDRSLLDVIEKAIAAKPSPDVLEPLTLALGLLGGSSSGTTLLSALEASDNDYARAHLIHAMGHLRDRSFIAPFLRVLGDATESEHSRVFAAIALGHLGDKNPVPRLTAITFHRNYMIPADTIDILTSLL